MTIHKATLGMTDSSSLTIPKTVSLPLGPPTAIVPPNHTGLVTIATSMPTGKIIEKSYFYWDTSIKIFILFINSQAQCNSNVSDNECNTRCQSEFKFFGRIEC